jgi:hypothetical protein
MTEQELLERLRKIEALIAGATSDGERTAAERAKERVKKRGASSPPVEKEIEYKFTLTDMWSRRLFVALARTHGLQPYRYKRQRHTTVMLRATESFVDATLWPQHQRFNDELRDLLSQITDSVIKNALGAVGGEARVVAPSRLPLQ